MEYTTGNSSMSGPTVTSAKKAELRQLAEDVSQKFYDLYNQLAGFSGKQTVMDGQRQQLISALTDYGLPKDEIQAIFDRDEAVNSITQAVLENLSSLESDPAYETLKAAHGELVAAIEKYFDAVDAII